MRNVQSCSLILSCSNNDSMRESVPLSDVSSRILLGTFEPKKKCNRCRSSFERQSWTLTRTLRRSESFN